PAHSARNLAAKYSRTGWTANSNVPSTSLVSAQNLSVAALSSSPARCSGPPVARKYSNSVVSMSDKERARPTFKGGYGHRPLWARADHGAAGTGDPLAVMLRAGNAGSNTAADHIAVIRDALRQLPLPGWPS